MKICRLCKHADGPYTWEGQRLCPPNVLRCKLKVDNVYGFPTSAVQMRAIGGDCGPDGRLWEQYPIEPHEAKGIAEEARQYFDGPPLSFPMLRSLFSLLRRRT